MEGSESLLGKRLEDVEDLMVLVVVVRGEGLVEERRAAARLRIGALGVVVSGCNGL